MSLVEYSEGAAPGSPKPAVTWATQLWRLWSKVSVYAPAVVGGSVMPVTPLRRRRRRWSCQTRHRARTRTAPSRLCPQDQTFEYRAQVDETGICCEAAATTEKVKVKKRK